MFFLWHTPEYESYTSHRVERHLQASLRIQPLRRLEHKYKGSFPLIATPNSQARCENFQPITIFERNRFLARTLEIGAHAGKVEIYMQQRECGFDGI